MPSERALTRAAQCWCDPRVAERDMDTKLATVVAEAIVAEAARVLGVEVEDGE